MKRISDFEFLVNLRIKSSNLPAFETEYYFLPDRRFRFDFAWPKKMLALECEGGVWTQGRHTRGVGFTNDCKKYNLAALKGWIVLRYTSNMIDDIIPDLMFLFNQLKEKGI